MKRLTARQSFLAQHIQTHSGIGTRELVEAARGRFTAASRLTIIRDLNQLCARRIIRRHGKGRGVHYVPLSQSSPLQWVAGESTPDRVFITRVFNYGTWDEWRQLQERFSENDVLAALHAPLPGQWTQRGRALAEVMYRVQLPETVLISYDA